MGVEVEEGSGRGPGTGNLARRTGTLSLSHIGMDGMLRWLFKQVNWAGLPRDRDRWIDGQNERGGKERAKERQRESDGAQRDGNRGRDEAMDGERRVWLLIRGTMGSVQSNQSSTVGWALCDLLNGARSTVYYQTTTLMETHL